MVINTASVRCSMCCALDTHFYPIPTQPPTAGGPEGTEGQWRQGPRSGAHSGAGTWSQTPGSLVPKPMLLTIVKRYRWNDHAAILNQQTHKKKHTHIQIHTGRNKNKWPAMSMHCTRLFMGTYYMLCTVLWCSWGWEGTLGKGDTKELESTGFDF